MCWVGRLTVETSRFLGEAANDRLDVSMATCCAMLGCFEGVSLGPTSLSPELSSSLLMIPFLLSCLVSCICVMCMCVHTHPQTHTILIFWALNYFNTF